MNKERVCPFPLVHTLLLCVPKTCTLSFNLLCRVIGSTIISLSNYQKLSSWSFNIYLRCWRYSSRNYYVQTKNICRELLKLKTFEYWTVGTKKSQKLFFLETQEHSVLKKLSTAQFMVRMTFLNNKSIEKLRFWLDLSQWLGLEEIKNNNKTVDFLFTEMYAHTPHISF